jgi:hypothetical protein
VISEPGGFIGYYGVVVGFSFGDIIVYFGGGVCLGYVYFDEIGVLISVKLNVLFLSNR